MTYPTIMKRLDQYKVGYARNFVLENNWSKLTPLLLLLLLLLSLWSRISFLLRTILVPFGNFTDAKIITKIFYPVFITGLSGNGKTFSIEHVLILVELIRVNLTIETDEDDLIGGFRLVDGNTVWHNGPVIEALERGAILLLDEIDLASNKVMCLQSFLRAKVYSQENWSLCETSSRFQCHRHC